MHICFVISSLCAGGAERVLTALANHLVMKGYKVSIITLEAPNTKPFYPLDPTINLVQINQRGQASSKIKRLFKIFTRLLKLRKAIKSTQPDVVISFMDIMNVMTLMATRGVKVPVIVSERTNPKYHAISQGADKLRQWVYPKADEVIVQTASAADCFANSANVTVIPNAVKPLPSQSRSYEKPVRAILSIGRLCPFKGFDTLIRAFALVHQGHPDSKVIIYGEGGERANLEALIKSLNLQDKVFLPGNTDNVPKALAEADMFVFPSHYEGFPNALCEAMASGLPAIASDCSGNVDVVQDKVNGRLFSVKEVQALADLMRELMEDQGQREKLGKAARTLSDQFNPTYVHGLWEAAIKKVVDPKP